MFENVTWFKSARIHLDAWGEFAVNFLQNYTVKIFENYFSNSQGHCEQESIDRMSKPIKERFYECLNMGNGATVRMHFVFWSDFAINFLQNHTVNRL